MRPERHADQDEKGQHMNPATSKTTRKAMRVATIFTGAAAVAAFGPAAGAAVGHAAGTGRQADVNTLTAAGPHVRTHEIRPDAGKLSGSIRSNSACPNANWVHLGYGGGYTWCYGYKGLWSYYPDLFAISKECGGNNYGWLYPYGESAIYFHQGTTYRRWTKGITISALRISGWAGNDKC
jgi:hypothetical protein